MLICSQFYSDGKALFDIKTSLYFLGNFCDGYEDGAYKKHPNNECSDYINCIKEGGKMYAVGNQCPIGQCIQFSTRYCVPCDSTFTCDELTTPGTLYTTEFLITFIINSLNIKYMKLNM